MKSFKFLAATIALVSGSSAFAEVPSLQYSCNDDDMTVRFTRNGEGATPQFHGRVSIQDQGVVEYFKRVLGNDFSDYYNGVGVWTGGGDVFCQVSENSCNAMLTRSETKLYRE